MVAPLNSCFMVPVPEPVTSGSATATTPTMAPASALRAHVGQASRAHVAFRTGKRRAHATAANAATSAGTRYSARLASQWTVSGGMA